MQKGLRSDNPCLGIKIKLDEPLPPAVTLEHLTQVIKHLNLDTFTGIRNAALFTLAFYTGARSSELLSLTIGDVLVGQRKVLIRSKGGKGRQVFLVDLRRRSHKNVCLSMVNGFPLTLERRCLSPSMVDAFAAKMLSR